MIAISQGVPIALHDDAEVFASWVEKEIGKSQYDEIFTKIGLPKFRSIATAFNTTGSIDRMFRLTMAWLYLHEQAHLFQCHGELPGMNASTRIVREFDLGDDARHEAPAVRHACEMAADFEATVLALQLMALSDNQRIMPGTLWLFFAGLTCMFQRFYGTSERPIDGRAAGSHPPPSYRAWMTRKIILGWLQQEDVQRRFEGPRDLQQAIMLLEHAHVTASMYWTAHHRTQQLSNGFLSGAGGLKPVDRVYQEQVLEAWRSVWPIVEERHFGWGGTTPHPDDLQNLMILERVRYPDAP